MVFGKEAALLANHLSWLSKLLANFELDEPLSDRLPRPEDSITVGHIRSAFGLTDFEVDVLLLCLGAQVDAELSAAIRKLENQTQPTFGLALAALLDANTLAASPSAPLRKFNLIQLDPAVPPLQSPLRLDEQILFSLLGISIDNPALSPLLLPGQAKPRQISDDMASTEHRAAFELLRSALASGADNAESQPTIVSGGSSGLRHAIVAKAAEEMGFRVRRVRLRDMPISIHELALVLRHMTRESRLAGCLFEITVDRRSRSGKRRLLIERLIDHNTNPFLVLSTEPGMLDPDLIEQSIAWIELST